MYTWTDRTGKVRRTYYPPPADQVQKKRKARKPTTSRRQNVGQNKVEIYTTTWCPYCKKATQFFKSKGIPYTTYNIETDKKAAARKKKLSGRSGVPFAVVNGQKIHGFSPKAYEAALKK
jgi:glutaredoxin-like YruB-family protein